MTTPPNETQTEAHRVIPAQEIIDALNGGRRIPELRDGDVVEGDVEVDSAHYRHKLAVVGVTFKGRVAVTDSKFARTVDFTRCTFERGINLSGSRVEGKLLLVAVRIPNTGTPANFRHLYVHGNLYAVGMESESPVDFTFATVASGEFSLRGARLTGQLQMVDARIGGDFYLDAGTGRPCELRGGASMFGISVGGTARLNGVAVTGDLNLSRSEIKQHLVFTGEQNHRATVTGDLNLSMAKVLGSTFFDGGLIEGTLNLHAAEFGLNLSFDSGGGHRAEIGGDANLARIKVGGGILFDGVRVGGNLTLFLAEITDVVSFDFGRGGQRTEVGGKASLFDMKAASGIYIVAAKFGGNVSLNNSEVGSGITVLGAQGLATEFGAGLSMTGLKFTGRLIIQGMRVAGEMSLYEADINGSFTMNAGGEGHRVEVEGRANFARALFGGQCLLEGVEFRGELSMDSARVGGDLFYIPFAGGAGSPPPADPPPVNFRNCEARGLYMRGDSFPSPVNLVNAQAEEFVIEGKIPARLDLTGFQCRSFSLPGDDYLRLLEASPFKKGTYLSVERVLREEGEEERAREVYLAMRRRGRGGAPLLRRFGSWLLDLTVGYGVKSHRLIVYLLVMLPLMAFLFSHPDALEPKEKPRPAAAVNAAAEQPPQRPKGQAIWTSVQVNFPMVSFLAADEWKPSGKAVRVGPLDPRASYRELATVVSTLNWVLVPLLLASASGLIKRQG